MIQFFVDEKQVIKFVWPKVCPICGKEGGKMLIKHSSFVSHSHSKRYMHTYLSIIALLDIPTQVLIANPPHIDVMPHPEVILKNLMGVNKLVLCPRSLT